MFNLIIILLLTLLLLIVIWLLRQYSYWKRRNVPTPSFTYILGHMKNNFLMKERFPDTLAKYYHHFKSLGEKHVGIFMFLKPVYMPIDNEIIKNILQKDFNYFMDRGMYINEKDDPLTNNLFLMEGQKWKIMRSKLSSVFTLSKIKNMIKTMVECSNRLNAVLDVENQPLEFKDVSSRVTMDIICRCSIGIECNTLQNSNQEFRKTLNQIFKKSFLGFINDLIILNLPDVAKSLHLTIFGKPLFDFFKSLVEEVISYRKITDTLNNDLMDLLIDLKNRSNLSTENELTFEELVSQVFLFVEAGYETSATAVTFCLLELSLNEDIQETLADEIHQVLQKYDNITYESIQEMKFLDKVLKETLRKYSPNGILNRICTKDYKVPGTELILKKGTLVIIPVHGIHYDSEIYPNPEVFNPNRFSEKNAKPPCTFLPFGEGPRNCIGGLFGMLQAKVVIITLVKKYKFDLNDKTTLPIQVDPLTFITTVKGGVWLNIKKYLR